MLKIVVKDRRGERNARALKCRLATSTTTRSVKVGVERCWIWLVVLIEMRGYQGNDEKEENECVVEGLIENEKKEEKAIRIVKTRGTRECIL